MVHHIEGGREIEQTKQSVVTCTNRLCDISHHLQQSGLGLVKLPVGRLMDHLILTLTVYGQCTPLVDELTKGGAHVGKEIMKKFFTVSCALRFAAPKGRN